jgi:hypothetical protein
MLPICHATTMDHQAIQVHIPSFLLHFVAPHDTQSTASSPLVTPPLPGSVLVNPTMR